MVGTSTDDSDVDPVTLVPSCIAIDDVDSVSSVQIIDSSFSVDLPDLLKHVSVRERNIDTRKEAGGIPQPSDDKLHILATDKILFHFGGPRLRLTCVIAMRGGGRCTRGVCIVCLRGILVFVFPKARFESSIPHIQWTDGEFVARHAVFMALHNILGTYASEEN